MRESLLPMLRCPVCAASDWALEPRKRDDSEVREGRLACRACGRAFPIADGAVDLVPLEMLTEAQAAEREKAAATTRRIAALKARGEWVGEKRARHERDRVDSLEATRFLFRNIEYDAPERRWVLALGRGEPHLANRFARLGFNLVALDFTPPLSEPVPRPPGDGPTGSERVAGLMANLPLGDRTMDVVFSHASLRRATPLRADTFRPLDPANLLDALREVKRVLKPDGLFLVSGETEYPEELSDEVRRREFEAQRTGGQTPSYRRSEYERAFREAAMAPNLWSQWRENRLRVGTFLDGHYREIVTAGDAVNARSDLLLGVPALKRDLDDCLGEWARVRPWPQDCARLPRSGGALPAGDGATFLRGWHERESDARGDFRWLGRDPAAVVFQLDLLPVAWTIELTVKACPLIGTFDAAVLVEQDGRVVAKETFQEVEAQRAGDREVRLDADLGAGRTTIRCIRDGRLRLHVYLNGDLLATLEPPTDQAFHTHRIEVPAEAMRTLNQLTFEPSYALRACDWSDSRDERWLSCAVRDIRIEPVEEDGTAGHLEP